MNENLNKIQISKENKRHQVSVIDRLKRSVVEID